VDELICKEFGIYQDEHNLQTMNKQGDIVEEDIEYIKRFLVLSEEIREESKNMKQVLTYQELEIIHKHLNKDSPVKLE
jgi:hypothetical protein